MAFMFAMNRPPIQAKTRDVSAAILVQPAIMRTTTRYLNPWKLQLSRFEANNVSRAISNAVSQPSRTQMWQGNGTAHWLVSSRIEPALSSCSTHMYNCRRARFGSVWGSCVGHPPVVTSPLLRGGLLVVLSPSIRTRLRRSSLLYRHRLPSRWPSRSSIVVYTSGLSHGP